MAHYKEVLSRLEGEDGVRVGQDGFGIVVRFSPVVSRYNLVGHTADILSSEELPFDGNYAITHEGDGDVVLSYCRGTFFNMSRGKRNGRAAQRPASLVFNGSTKLSRWAALSLRLGEGQGEVVLK